VLASSSRAFLVRHRKVYSVRCEADVVMTSVIVSEQRVFEWPTTQPECAWGLSRAADFIEVLPWRNTVLEGGIMIRQDLHEDCWSGSVRIRPISPSR
jgi:hypothetical protein